MIVGATLNGKHYDMTDPVEAEAFRQAKVALRAKRGSFGMPAIHGDAIYKGSDDGFGRDENSRRIARAAALAAGVNPEGKRYVSGLVRPEVGFGDPAAWVDKGEARSQIRRRCEKEGWECNGRVEVKGRNMEANPTPLDQYEVADDITDAETERTIQEEKLSLTPSEKVVLRQKTKDRLSGKK
jgi:hypothetical protein